MSVEDATNATAAAMVATTTAEALAATQATQEPQATVVSVTPEPTETTVVEATVAPQPTAEPEEGEESAPATEATTHTVQAGENLYRIALKHGLTYQALAAHNGITNPNLIFPGQELKIPASGGTAPTPSGDGFYTVQVGDNLFRIALAYNMLFTDLASANGLSYPYTIYPGQRLTIP
jgi:LysM repeat protein